jgi:hypothetical protein
VCGLLLQCMSVVLFQNLYDQIELHYLSLRVSVWAMNKNSVSSHAVPYAVKLHTTTTLCVSSPTEELPVEYELLYV